MVKLKALFPKQANFFRIFERLADTAAEASRHLEELLEHPGEKLVLIERISEIETQADQIIHSAIANLHETFVTPMDRTHIHQLLLKVDEMVDLTCAVAERVRVYQIKQVPQETLNLAHTVRETVEKTKDLLYELENLKEPVEIFRHCVEINRLENTADSLMRIASGKLMEIETQFQEFVKQKELIDVLESITDRAEDVAHLVEAIVLDHA